MLLNKRNVAIITLGCDKNEIDSELMMSILADSGFNIIENLYDAEIIIINTCSFIDAAKEQSIELIWEMTRYKDEGNCKYLILAGCLAERYPEELLDEIEQVDAVLGTGNISEIGNIISALDNKNKRIKRIGNINCQYLEGIKRPVSGSTACVKIAEGCNNFCTYCIIPKLRGKYRSRKIEDIVEEVRYMVKNGTKEIILIAQNTTDYGIDLYGEYKLPELLKELNEIEGLKWIRLFYLYPDNFTPELIEAIDKYEKVLKYVDIPIQHINNEILKNMNRKTNKKQIFALINSLREKIPNIIIRTTIIVGFPGETEEQFNELYEFIENVKFDRLGVFTYSQEEGTVAGNYKNQIDQDTKNLRKDALMKLQRNISLIKNEDKIGKVYDVLIEEIWEDDIYIGRTYMDSPEIDGVFYVRSNKILKIGSFVTAKVTDCLEYDLMGEIVNESGE